MLKHAFLAAIAMAWSGVAQSDTPAPAAGPSDAQRALLASLHPKTGDIAIPEAKAHLKLGEAYEFLDAAESKKVLTEGWGNPAGATEGVLGMIFPAGKTFLDGDSWGAVITYDKTLFVSDEDVTPAEYDKLLTDMRSGEEEENAQREKSGFPTVHLVGWAQPPSYERAKHNLIWAREIRFGDSDVDTLNYDTRHLGREGVLSLNIISTMPHLEEIRAAAPKLAGAAEFDPGSRYADHQKDDKVAGFGLVGLVAAGAGLVVAKKAGLVALLLIFAKKGAALLVVGGAAVANWARRLFGKKPVPPPSWAQDDDATGDPQSGRDPDSQPPAP